ncbi:hypothetical protein RugamoR64_04790 [Duganella rhizosphaerae]
MLVVDQEAGVDAVAAAFERDVDGIGVAAQIVARFKQHDIMLSAEKIGAGQAGDAGADDGDAFACWIHVLLLVILAAVLPAC